MWIGSGLEVDQKWAGSGPEVDQKWDLRDLNMPIALTIGI